MAIIVTGGKYIPASISAVGTITVRVGAALFISTDFNVTRLVALFDSTGINLKGIAWVRAYFSTTLLQLQTQFFDPATGTTVTQLVGDIIIVSKNFLENVTAGLTVTGNNVVLTDSFTIINGCFYDENKNITTNNNIAVTGGIGVWGKLDLYSENSVSSPCILTSTVATSANVLSFSSTIANLCWYGGQIIGTNLPNYIGNGTTYANTVIINSIGTNCIASSPITGRWGPNTARCQIINSNFITNIAGTVCDKWGDGISSENKYRVLYNSALPFGIFSSDVPGTYNKTTTPGKRSIVTDMGAVSNLVSSTTSSFNFTNLITLNFKNTGTSQINKFSFSDTYTGIITGSIGIVMLNSDGSIVDSNSYTNTTWTPSILRRQFLGLTQQFVRGPWTYSLKKYGYLPAYGTIASSTYNIGFLGNADNVSFGGAIKQIADSKISLSQSLASALTEISSLDDLYDVSVHWGSIDTTYAQYPNITTYPAVGSGLTLTFSGIDITLDGNATSAYSLNIGTNSLIIKTVVLDFTNKFDTLIAPTINITSATEVSCKLVGSITNEGIITNSIIGNVINIGAIYSVVVGNVSNSGTLETGTNISGNVEQAIPSDMTGVTISGTLTYNTDVDTTITFTDCTIGTIENIGTGIITIFRVRSTITNYIDPEINFTDSSISVIGADYVTFHPTYNDCVLNTNISGTFIGYYPFKYGTTINGSLMSGTLYLRCVSGDVPFPIEKNISLGDNIEDLGISAQLSSIKLQLLTKPTLVDIESSTVLSKTTDITSAVSDIKGVDNKDITSAVSDIKGVDNKDITQVFNNTPSIDPASVWTYSDRTLTQSIGGIFRGGDYFNAQDRKYIKDTHEKIITLENTNINKISEKLNDIDSHIELAKDDIIDTIKETENEVCSDIVRKSKELKEDNITTRNLVRQKTKKIDENVSKLAYRQEMTDKMIESEADEIEDEINASHNKEADEIEDEIRKQHEKEADEIESNL